ncbi:SPOR domain-containing protein [bacterium]|nr:SPOR domain-containing protein [bacterium]
MKKIYLFLLISVFAIGCASTKKPIKTEEPETEETKSSGDPIDILIGETTIPDIEPVTDEVQKTEVVDTLGNITQNDYSSYETTQTNKVWKVQVISVSNENSANTTKRQIESSGKKDVSVVNENGLWKVQVGSFSDRFGAEKLRDELKNSGYEGAFLVQSVQQQGSAEKGFKIQVFASGKEENANNFAEKIRKIQNEKVSVEYSKQDGLYKVRIGNYQTREQAKLVSEKIKNLNIEGKSVQPFVVGE